MNKTREEKIANCGKSSIFMRKKGGTIYAFPNYCHIRGCERCDKYEAWKRRKLVAEALASHQGDVLRAVISVSDWKRIGQQLSENNIDYVSVQQDEDTRLLICSDNPYKRKDIGLQAVSKDSAIKELCLDENIFPEHGSRSTGGNWRLTEERETFSDEMYVVEFVPSWIASTQMQAKYGLTDNSVPYWFQNDIFANANTWTKGAVSFEAGNVQEFMNYSMNKAISLAEMKGARIDFEGCRFQAKLVGKERIDQWAVAMLDNPNLQVQGDDALFSGEEYLLIHNVIEPRDYIGEYREYLEQENIARLKEELGDAYYIFYPEQLEGVYDEAEQAELDKELVY